MAGAASGRIDVHHHFFAPDYLGAIGDMAKRPEVRGWSLAHSFEEMEKNGVATAMLSLSPPGIHLGDRAATKTLARAVNEHAAKLRADHPARFGHFASVPMPNVDDTLAELAYALDALHADGIQLMTSYRDQWAHDKWLGDPDFDPVFAELNRRRALVFVHPLLPACCAGALDWIPPAMMEFTHDTNRAVMSLLLTGTLTRYPDIRFIFCHAGAAVPILAGRIVVTGAERMFKERIPQGVDRELKKLYYDVALAANKPALAALFTYLPVSQVLLGSDYPFGTATDGIAGLAEYGLSPADLEAIHRGNAQRLIPRLKG
jgi:predicted TIM-barrel fold metal-dependent hydrolase